MNHVVASLITYFTGEINKFKEEVLEEMWQLREEMLLMKAESKSRQFQYSKESRGNPHNPSESSESS